MFVFCVCSCEVVAFELPCVGHRFQFFILLFIAPWLVKLSPFLCLISHDDLPKKAFLDFSCGRGCLASCVCSVNLQFSMCYLQLISQANLPASLACIWIVPVSLAKARGRFCRCCPSTKVICVRASSLSLSIRGTSSGEALP